MNSQEGPARLVQEKILYLYSSALERGNLDQAVEILEKASSDPVLTHKLEELNIAYYEEIMEEGLLPQREAGSPVQTPLQYSEDAPLLEPLPFPEPLVLKPRNTYWRLALVAGLLVALAGIISLVSWSVSQVPTVAPLTAAATLNPPGLDLHYPGATVLTVDPKAFKIDDPTPHYRMEALATGDSDQQVAEYYRQKLMAAGYNVQNNTVSASSTPDPTTNLCGNGACTSAGIYSITGWNNGYLVNVLVLGSEIAQSQNLSSGLLNTGIATLIKQLKPGQTFILNTFGPYISFNPAVTPLSAADKSNLEVYVGPDSGFHFDNGSGLVSTAAPESVSVSEGNATFQAYWLISDTGGTRLGAIVVGGSARTGATSGVNLGILTDETGKTYPLNSAVWHSSTNLGQVTTGWVMSGPQLPSSVRKVTFTAGGAAPFALSVPLTIKLATFKDASLPKATRLPTTVVNSPQGVKAQVTYSYFGSDRTILGISVDPADYRAKAGWAGLRVGPFGLATATGRTGVQVLDTQGNPLPEFTQSDLITRLSGEQLPTLISVGLNQPGLSTIVLGPVPAGNRSVTVKVLGIEVEASSAQPANTTLDIPLDEMLKGEVTQPGGSPVLELNGFKVQVQEMQAKLDQKVNLVNLSVKYRVQSNPLNTNVRSVSFECVGCSQASPASSFFTEPETSISKGAGTETQTFKYDPTQKNLRLRISKVNYELLGPWELTVPVP